MYNTILVPLDGSDRAEAILPHVENLACHGGSRVILIRVMEPANRTAIIDLDRETEVTFKPQQVNESKNYLIRWRDRLQELGIDSEIMVLRGVAVDAILHAVETTGADLLAMTNIGKTGWAKMLYGSVSIGVLNRVRCPFLLVQAQTRPALGSNNRILVPLDMSVKAERTLPYVENLAHSYEAKITLMHVVRAASDSATYLDPGSEMADNRVKEHLFNQLGKNQEVERVEAARHYLLNSKSILQERHCNVEVKLLYGQPVPSIARVAEDINANLVAIAHVGRTGVERFFYSSVASGVIEHSTRPLLIIPSGDEPVRNFA